MPSSSMSTSVWSSIVGEDEWTGGRVPVVGLHLFLTMGMGEDPFFGTGTGTGTSAQARLRSGKGEDGEMDRAKLGVDCAALDNAEG